MATSSPQSAIKVLEATASLDGWGGIEKIVVELGRRLTRPEFEVSTCVGKGFPLELKIESNLIEFKSAGSTSFRKLLQYNRAINEFQPQIVHAHFSPDYFPAGLAAKIQKVRATVLTRHMALPWSRAKATTYSKLYQKIVCVSHAVEKRLLDSGIVPSQLSVIHGGILWPGDEQSEQRVMGPNKLVYMGRLVPEKGVFALLKAVQLVPDVQCEIWGDGPHRDQIQKEIARLNLSARVTLCGFNESIREIFVPGSILVVPSECDDALPTVIAEAFAYRIPVIASERGGIPEMITSGANGLLFPSGDIPALAHCIRQMIDQPKMVETFKVAGYKTLHAKFHANIMMDGYASLFRSLCEPV